MGRPRYREVSPGRLPGPVRGLVECAWRAEVPHGVPAAEQRVLPDGCMDLLLLDGRVLVAGPDTAAHLAVQVPGSAVTGLRFRPGRLPALLGVPAEALRDERVALDELVRLPQRPSSPYPGRSPGVGRPARSTAPDVPENTAEMRLRVVAGPVHDPETHLGGVAIPGLPALLATTAALGRAAERHCRPLPDPLPGAALRALAAGVPAAELAARLGVTTRTLHRRSLATLGYGPSVARRVLRFRAAAALLHAGVAPAEAAARTGYADQPHLSREVRALAGVSPAALAAPPVDAP